MSERNDYWFPAKTYGWGWGVPRVWQGQVVLALFVVLIIAAGVVFPPDQNPQALMSSVAVLTGLFLGVCYLKGEPPRWRWGKSADSR